MKCVTVLHLWQSIISAFARVGHKWYSPKLLVVRSYLFGVNIHLWRNSSRGNFYNT